MSATIALVGDVLQHGRVVLAAGDDLAPSQSSAVNLNLTLWSTIAGFVTPLAVAVINQPRWSPFVRAMLTLVFCVGVAAATAALEGKLNGTRWTTAALLVIASAIVTYQTVWKNVAPSIERATSPGVTAAAELN